MVDTLGLPTVFFTHSAADVHWPELAHLLAVEDPTNSTSRPNAVIEKPCLALLSSSSWMCSMLEFSKPRTTGSDLSSSTKAVLMSMVLPG